jgi:hypothetical protein
MYIRTSPNLKTEYEWILSSDKIKMSHLFIINIK